MKRGIFSRALVAIVLLMFCTSMTFAEDSLRGGFKAALLQELQITVEHARQAGEKIVDFAYQQAPLLVQEILKWKMTINFIGFILLLLIVAGSVWFIVKVQSWSDSDAQFGGTFVGIIICVGSSVGAWFCFSAWLQILIAPRLYLLEYISNLFK